MAKPHDFAHFIREKLAADLDLSDAVEREAFNADIATQIYDARRQAGLTQGQLAKRINTQQSVIARLENADYDGHSLSMLRRIADAVGKKLEVGFFSKVMPDLPVAPIIESLEIDWPPESHEKNVWPNSVSSPVSSNINTD